MPCRINGLKWVLIFVYGRRELPLEVILTSIFFALIFCTGLTPRMWSAAELFTAPYYIVLEHCQSNICTPSPSQSDYSQPSIPFILSKAILILHLTFFSVFFFFFIFALIWHLRRHLFLYIVTYSYISLNFPIITNI